MKPAREKKRIFSNPEIQIFASDVQILATEVHEGFRRVDERFESVKREMDVHFDAVEKRFDSFKREIQARFNTVNWALGFGFTLMIGFLGIILKFVIN